MDKPTEANTPSTTALTGDYLKELLVPLLLSKHGAAEAKHRLKGVDWQEIATALNALKLRAQQQRQQLERHAQLINSARSFYAALHQFQKQEDPLKDIYAPETLEVIQRADDPPLELIRQIDEFMLRVDPNWSTDNRGHLLMPPWVTGTEEVLVFVARLLAVAYPGRNQGQRVDSPLVQATVTLMGELGFDLSESALAAYLQRAKRTQ